MLNSAIKTLAKSYPGDAAWDRYVMAIAPTPIPAGPIEGLPDDIAAVLIAHLGSIERAKRWMTKSLPALGGTTPAKVLQTRREGDVILKTVLMRFP